MVSTPGDKIICSLRIPATAFTDPCTPTAFAMLFVLAGGSGVLSLNACDDSVSWCLMQPRRFLIQLASVGNATGNSTQACLRWPRM